MFPGGAAWNSATGMANRSPGSSSLGLRLLQFPLVRLVIGFVFVLAASLLSTEILRVLGQSLLSQAALDSWYLIILNLIPSILSLCAYAVFVRFVERRQATEVGVAGLLTELGEGILVGSGLMILAVGLIWILGSYQVVAVNGLANLYTPLGLAIFAGVVEEILFRALLFRIFEEWLGSWMALGISALFFGFAHLGNPNATLFASVAIALEAGLLLGAVYMYSRRLWLAIGLHFAWNFVQGGIFGVAVSGTDQGGLLEANVTGSPLISGGDFGVEASVIALVLCLLAMAYYFTRERVLFKAAPWKQAVV